MASIAMINGRMSKKNNVIVCDGVKKGRGIGRVEQKKARRGIPNGAYRRKRCIDCTIMVIYKNIKMVNIIFIKHIKFNNDNWP